MTPAFIAAFTTLVSCILVFIGYELAICKCRKAISRMLIDLMLQESQIACLKRRLHSGQPIRDGKGRFSKRGQS